MMKLFTVLMLFLSFPALPEECEGLYAKIAAKSVGRKLKVNLSEASKFVLSTESGKNTLTAFGFKDTNEMIKFLEQVDLPVNKLFRKHVLDILHEIDQEVATFRGQMVRQGLIRGGKDATTQLSEEEKILIEILGQRLLRPNSEAAEVLKNPTKANLKQAKFFKDPIKTKFDGKNFVPQGIVKAEGAAKNSLIKNGQRFYSAMRECTANMPKLEASFSKRAVKEALKQIAISEAVTAGAAVAVASAPHLERMDEISVKATADAFTSGISEVRVKDLSINLIMTAISNGLGTFLLNGNASMTVRYLQAMFLHETLDVVSAGLYVLTPSSEDKYQAPVKDYWFLSALWGVGGTAAGVPLNAFLTGLSCLYPNASWVGWANIGARTSFSIGINVLYFASANSFLYPQPEEKK